MQSEKDEQGTVDSGQRPWERFPAPPRCSEDIYTFKGKPEYLACAIIRQQTVRQLMAFRNLRIAMGDNQRFLDALAEGVEILAHSSGIKSPAGWLYDFIRKEAGV